MLARRLGGGVPAPEKKCTLERPEARQRPHAPLHSIIGSRSCSPCGSARLGSGVQVGGRQRRRQLLQPAARRPEIRPARPEFGLGVDLHPGGNGDADRRGDGERKRANAYRENRRPGAETGRGALPAEPRGRSSHGTGAALRAVLARPTGRLRLFGIRSLLRSLWAKRRGAAAAAADSSFCPGPVRIDAYPKAIKAYVRPDSRFKARLTGDVALS